MFDFGNRRDYFELLLKYFQVCGLYFPDNMRIAEKKLTKFWTAILYCFEITGTIAACYSYEFLYFNNFSEFAFLLSANILDNEALYNGYIFTFNRSKVNMMIEFLCSKNSQTATKIEKVIYFKYLRNIW